MSLTEKELSYYKEMLEEQKQDLLDEIRELESKLSLQDGYDESEQNIYSTHQADVSDSLYDRELLVDEHERALNELKEIKTSLKQISEGNYGICIRCGAEIPKPRLEVVPYAKTCVKCPRKIELGEEEF